MLGGWGRWPRRSRTTGRPGRPRWSRRRPAAVRRRPGRRGGGDRERLVRHEPRLAGDGRTPMDDVGGQRRRGRPRRRPDRRREGPSARSRPALPARRPGGAAGRGVRRDRLSPAAGRAGADRPDRFAGGGRHRARRSRSHRWTGAGCGGRRRHDARRGDRPPPNRSTSPGCRFRSRSHPGSSGLARTLPSSTSRPRPSVPSGSTTLARRAREVRDRPVEERARVAHTDWCSRNVRVVDGTVVAAYDWDAVTWVTPSIAVGQAAALWPCTGEPDSPPASSPTELRRLRRRVRRGGGDTALRAGPPAGRRRGALHPRLQRTLRARHRPRRRQRDRTPCASTVTPTSTRWTEPLAATRDGPDPSRRWTPGSTASVGDERRTTTVPAGKT